jgi:molybdate transport system substrate-binding protein
VSSGATRSARVSTGSGCMPTMLPPGYRGAMRRARWRVLLPVLIGAALAGCGTGGANVTSGQLTIYTTPALADTVGAMTHAFTTTYPAVRLQTVVEPDAQMPQHIAQGPTPDVIVAEDPATLTAAGVADAPVHFAQGQLVIAVRADDPAPVRGLADLGRPDIRVALCAPEQPCGNVAAALLAAAQVTPAGPILEPDVRSALAHVTDGTAQAALVYRFTAEAAGDAVHTVEVPQSGAKLADLVAVVPARTTNAAVARSFLDYLASEPVREVLIGKGFTPPAS